MVSNVNLLKKERFDASGKGKGKEGRVDPEVLIIIGNLQQILQHTRCNDLLLSLLSEFEN